MSMKISRYNIYLVYCVLKLVFSLEKVLPNSFGAGRAISAISSAMFRLRYHQYSNTSVKHAMMIPTKITMKTPPKIIDPN